MTRLVLMHDAAAACKVAWIATIVEHGGDAQTIDMLERANWRAVTGEDPAPAPEG